MVPPLFLILLMEWKKLFRLKSSVPHNTGLRFGHGLASTIFGCLAKMMTLRTNPSYGNKCKQNFTLLKGSIDDYAASYPICETEKTGEIAGEVRMAADMHQRKAEMACHSGCFIALPGGYGTQEELLEVIS